MTILSCNRFKRSKFDFTLQDSTIKKHTLDDSNSPLGQIYNITRTGKEDILIADGSPSIELYKHFTFTRSFGKKEKGPCEFLRTPVNATAGDTLYLMDDIQGKLITYNLNTGGCIREVTYHDLQLMDSITPLHGTLYLTRGNFSPAMQPNDTVFYKINDRGRLQPLDLLYKDLNAIHFLTPVKIPMGTKAHLRRDTLYFFYPFTHEIWKLDLKTNHFSSIILNEMQWPQKELEASNNLQRLISLLKETEIIWDIFPMSGYIAVTTFKPFYKNQD